MPKMAGVHGTEYEMENLMLRLLINNLSAGDRHHHGNGKYLARPSFVEVLGIHNDVRQHSGRNSSLALLFELREGGADGVGAETILRAQALLRLPAAFGRAIGQLARNAGVNSAKRIDGYDGIVRAEG